MTPDGSITSFRQMSRLGGVRQQVLRGLEPGDRIPGSTGAEPAKQEELEKQAQLWVGQTFFGTLLKQMRQSPFRSEMFQGGRGGSAFGALYDQQMAQRMARGAGGKLARSIVRKLSPKSAYAPQQVNANVTTSLRA
ncbi:MAG: rod-binding protein [Tepidisphaeraceae bacterium]